MVTITSGIVIALVLGFLILAWLAGMIYIVALVLTPIAAARKISQKHRQNP